MIEAAIQHAHLPNTWGVTFLLTYPGANMFLIYAQGLKSRTVFLQRLVIN